MNKIDGQFPQLGFGLGLRPKHYNYIFEQQPPIDWFEIISENYMDTGGKPRRNLNRIAERYPLVMHGVALSIGTIDPLNSEYLQKLKTLADDIKPAWISDHLCWTGVAHKNSHDLLPVPYTEEALKHIVSRIIQVQDYLGRPIALENPSTYLEFKSSHIAEAEFIARMAKESGCNLLLDVNNVYVSCYNHRLSAQAYIDALPLERVVQIHLSGHTNNGNHIVDTHDNHVIDEVWALYKYVVHKAARVPNTMVEWDDKIPEFPVLAHELQKARNAAAQALAPAAQPFNLPDLAAPQTAYIANISTALAEAQNTMQEAILRGAQFDAQPDSWIRSKTDFNPKDQLGVYINAYRYRLYDVVAEDYPVLQHYLGTEKFESLIWDFVNNAQSDHFNIGRFALKLPAFLHNHAAADVFAKECCAFETAIAQLADYPETVALTPAHLAGMAPEALWQSVLYPRRALQLFAFTYPVYAYYQAVKQDEAPQPPLPEKSPEKSHEKSYAVVFRHDDVVWRMSLEANEYHLLSKLFSGQTIGAALADLDESVATQISTWFDRWMRNGLLAVNADIIQPQQRSVA